MRPPRIFRDVRFGLLAVGDGLGRRHRPALDRLRRGQQRGRRLRGLRQGPGSARRTNAVATTTARGRLPRPCRTTACSALRESPTVPRLPTPKRSPRTRRRRTPRGRSPKEDPAEQNAPPPPKSRRDAKSDAKETEAHAPKKSGCAVGANPVFHGERRTRPAVDRLRGPAAAGERFCACSSAIVVGPCAGSLPS